MRGEHFLDEAGQVENGGSSPHARGALPYLTFSLMQFGIIPACAGSTQGRGQIRSCERDHPRMRGEHAAGIAASDNMQGSSPHARGAHTLRAMDQEAPWIIPACAGSTASTVDSFGASRDHPRMRGEHSTLPTLATSVTGSSPHARGAHALKDVLVIVRGIIPACAGSTQLIPSRPVVSRDHPRMRGEHGDAGDFCTRFEGSSPHARGALRRSLHSAAAAGIIPACAGSTD